MLSIYFDDAKDPRQSVLEKKMKIALILMTLGIFRLGQKAFFEEFKINSSH